MQVPQVRNTIFPTFVYGACTSRFAHRHARRPILGSCGCCPGSSKLPGAGWLGSVFTNHDAFGLSNATPVHGTPKCNTPPILSEIHAISICTKFFSTLDHLDRSFENAKIGLLAWRWAKRNAYENRKYSILTSDMRMHASYTHVCGDASSVRVFWARV
jgi:hypothetical protein